MVVVFHLELFRAQPGRVSRFAGPERLVMSLHLAAYSRTVIPCYMQLHIPIVVAVLLGDCNYESELRAAHCNTVAEESISCPHRTTNRGALLGNESYKQRHGALLRQ